MIVSCNSEEGVARASTNDARMREVCCVVHGDEPNDADELLNGAELLNGDELINGDELLDSGDLLVYLDFTDNENILEDDDLLGEERITSRRQLLQCCVGRHCSPYAQTGQRQMALWVYVFDDTASSSFAEA